MVIRNSQSRRKQSGMLMTDLIVAMGILVLTLIPLSFSFLSEQKASRAYYERAVAMEIVDGEMEKLAAGGWRDYPRGTQAYTVTGEAAKNLHGTFTLTLNTERIRLEWIPEGKGHGGHVVREGRLR